MDREKFLGRAARNMTVEITLSDGETVKARKLTQSEVEEIRRRFGSEGKVLEGLRFVVARTLLDDNGERVFADEDMSLIAKQVNFDDVKAITTAVSKFSGLQVDAKND